MTRRKKLVFVWFCNSLLWCSGSVCGSSAGGGHHLLHLQLAICMGAFFTGCLVSSKMGETDCGSRNGSSQRCLCEKSSCCDNQPWIFWLFRGAKSARRKESRRQSRSHLTSSGGCLSLPLGPSRCHFRRSSWLGTVVHGCWSKYMCRCSQHCRDCLRKVPHLER